MLGRKTISPVWCVVFIYCYIKSESNNESFCFQKTILSEVHIVCK